ncbi:MAG: endonuclease III [Halobacteria archaeon]|nr:endonuclease III [Halobacteria archaeon]
MDMDCETFRGVVDRLEDEYAKEARRTDPWEETVMTVLSQNTSDDNRDVAYENLVEKYETPREILEADIDEIRELIAPAGLANSKSEYLVNAARHIVENRGGDTDWIRDEPPEDVHDELTSIKGIGHKTADVILLFAAGADLCPVDTHVDRVTHRDRLIELRDECGVDLRSAHVNLIAHGRETCSARSPDCGSCVVEDLCSKNGVEG